MTTVIRPTWTPASDEQRRLLAEAVQIAEAAKRAQAEAARLDEEMWAAILAARTGGIPDTVLCERTGQSRATLNRRYGPRES